LLLLGIAVVVEAWSPLPQPHLQSPLSKPRQQPQQHNQHPLSELLRPLRKAALVLSVALCLPSAARAFPGLEDCKSESNPSFTVVTCENHVGIENGRCVSDFVSYVVRLNRHPNQSVDQPTHTHHEHRPKRCQSSENCISTSSVQSASKYASPWVYNTDE